MAKPRKWTAQRLNKASDELEREGASIGSAGRAVDSDRKALSKKIGALKEKIQRWEALTPEGKKAAPSKKPTPSERRLVEVAEKYQAGLPVQVRVDGKLAKGSEIAKLSTPPEATRSKLRMAEHQEEFVEDVLPKAKGLLIGWLGAVQRKWGDDFEGVTFDQDGNKLSELVIKATSEVGKNFPKHVEGNHNVKSTHVHEVKQLSDEDLKAQLEATREKVAQINKAERVVKSLRPAEQVIDAEFREVAHANG